MSQARLSLFSGVSCTFGNIHSLKRNSFWIRFPPKIQKRCLPLAKIEQKRVVSKVFFAPLRLNRSKSILVMSVTLQTSRYHTSLLGARWKFRVKSRQPPATSAGKLGSFLPKPIQTSLGKCYSWRNTRGSVRRRWPWCPRGFAKLEIIPLGSEQMPKQISGAEDDLNLPPFRSNVRGRQRGRDRALALS